MHLPGQVIVGRLMWWPPWTSSWFRLKIWAGEDEWCARSSCLTLPLAGSLILFREHRTMPCAECWALMCDEQRADYLPGGYLEGGKVHPDRAIDLIDEVA